MDRSKFIADQRDITLDAIQRVQPNFVVNYTPPDLAYANPLLNHLNDKVLSCNEASQKDLNIKMPGSEIMNSKRGYSKSDLEEKARSQLQIELDGCITIKSIEKSKGFPNAEYCVSAEKRKMRSKTDDTYQINWHYLEICFGIEIDFKISKF